MDQEPPLMFYCKQCKTMLNEKCFYDCQTGNLSPICTMCSLLNTSRYLYTNLMFREENFS